MSGIQPTGKLVAMLSWVLLGWAGCAANHAVPQEAVAAAEQRLLSPYSNDRAIVADEIEIVISANFDAEVARPATTAGLHDFEHATEGDVAIHRWISKGGLQSPLQFIIGKTRLVALQSATLRILGTGSSYVLDAKAKGTVSESAGGQMKDWREIRIENGVFSRR